MKKADTKEFINPIDKDKISDQPSTLRYGHHRGSFPVIPTKKGTIKTKALAVMEEQTNIQLQQIKEQMKLLADQASKIQQRVEISQMIYNAEIKFEPLVSHKYHLYENDEGDYLLSMIGPKDWGFKGNPYNFISSVKLLGDHTWEMIH